MPSHVSWNNTAATVIYTLSLHDALPIYYVKDDVSSPAGVGIQYATDKASLCKSGNTPDTKCTYLNCNHGSTLYGGYRSNRDFRAADRDGRGLRAPPVSRRSRLRRLD